MVMRSFFLAAAIGFGFGAVMAIPMNTPVGGCINAFLCWVFLMAACITSQ